MWCWGQNEFGILGEFTQVDTPQRLQIPGLERVRELALSKTKACAIRWDDSVLCWGTDRYAGSNYASNQPLSEVELSPVLNNERPSFAEVHLGDGFGLATTTLGNGKGCLYMGHKADADVTETCHRCRHGELSAGASESWAVSDQRSAGPTVNQ